jgi:hypothetical protein
MLMARLIIASLSTQIHSAAPFCGIDPSLRQRVDSIYKQLPLCSQKSFQSSQQNFFLIHATGFFAVLLVDKSKMNQGRNHPDPGSVTVRDGKH